MDPLSLLSLSSSLSRGEDPFCETCYHNMYGVECQMCRQYITGRVLEVSVPNSTFTTPSHSLTPCRQETSISTRVVPTAASVDSVSTRAKTCALLETTSGTWTATRSGLSRGFTQVGVCNHYHASWIHIHSCAIYINFCVFKLFCLSVMDTLTCCYTDTESSSEGSRSRSRTRSVGTTPSPPG